MTVSIIVPTANRCVSLANTLRSLTQLDHDPNSFEVIIVENGSTDNTRDSFDAIRRAFPRNQWKYFYESMPGLLSGRHRGALEANGEICVFLDDDVHVGSDWLNALEEAFRDSQVHLVGGASKPLLECDPPNWLAAFYGEDQHGRYCTWLSLFDGGEAIKQINPLYVWGLNFAIRKQTLFDLGGFHPDSLPKSLQRYQGDGETGLSLKFKQAGLKALYHPQVSVEHEVSAARLTIEYFEQRAFFQGVCNSYTQIRSDRQVLKSRFSWKDPVRRLKQSLARSVVDKIRTRTVNAYKAGYTFHQKEVGRDPKLLNWVLRKDYWNYQLPNGWQNYYTPCKLGK